jgi:hypothetical protein
VRGLGQRLVHILAVVDEAGQQGVLADQVGLD